MSTPHIGAYLKTRKYNNPGSSSKYKNRSFFSLAIHAAFIAFLLLSSLDHNGYQVYCHVYMLVCWCDRRCRSCICSPVAISVLLKYASSSIAHFCKRKSLRSEERRVGKECRSRRSS